MARFMKIELAGLKETIAKLEGVKQGMQNRVLRPAMNEALTPIVQAVKAEMPSSSGLAKRSIKKKVVTTKAGKVVGLVGATGKKAQQVTRPDGSTVYEDPSKILHLIEGGRKAVQARGGAGKSVLSSGKGGKVYGTTVRAAAGKHPLAKGWASSKAQAEAIFIRRAQQEIAKLAAKGKI